MLKEHLPVALSDKPINGTTVEFGGIARLNPVVFKMSFSFDEVLASEQEYLMPSPPC